MTHVIALLFVLAALVCAVVGLLGVGMFTLGPVELVALATAFLAVAILIGVE